MWTQCPQVLVHKNTSIFHQDNFNTSFFRLYPQLALFWPSLKFTILIPIASFLPFQLFLSLSLKHPCGTSHASSTHTALTGYCESCSLFHVFSVCPDSELMSTVLCLLLLYMSVTSGSACRYCIHQIQYWWVLSLFLICIWCIINSWERSDIVLFRCLPLCWHA